MVRIAVRRGLTCRVLVVSPNFRQESHSRRCSTRHCQFGIPTRQIVGRVSTESRLRFDLKLEPDRDRWNVVQPTEWRPGESSVGRRKRSRMPSAVVSRQSVGSKQEPVFPSKTETTASRQSPSRGRYVRECRLPNGRCRYFHGATAREDPVTYRPVDFLQAVQRSHLIEYDDSLDFRWCRQDNHNPGQGPPRWCRCRAKLVFRRCRSCVVVFSQVSLAGIMFAEACDREIRQRGKLDSSKGNRCRLLWFLINGRVNDTRPPVG